MNPPLAAAVSAAEEYVGHSPSGVPIAPLLAAIISSKFEPLVKAAEELRKWGVEHDAGKYIVVQVDPTAVAELDAALQQVRGK